MLIFQVSALCILSTFLHAQENPEEIRVALTSDHPLATLYLGKFKSSAASLGALYIEELQNTLYFDLNYNGYTTIVPHKPDKEQLLSSPKEGDAFNPKIWKEAAIAYVVRGAIEESFLNLQIYSTLTSSLKSFSKILLSGLISQDRRTIHKIADQIQKTLFDSEGIANTRILFSLQQKDLASSWISEIWECDWDGKEARQVTHEQSYNVTPFFLPSNLSFATDRFLYVSYKKGQPKIYIASLKEGKGTKLISLRGNQLLPAVSPRRDKIAFICDASGRTDLFIQPFHPDKGEMGKPVQLFSFPRSTQASPTFSPDGMKIAFVSDKDGSPRIYTVPAVFTTKRATPELITKKNKESSCPAWSPDGKKLAYSARTNGIRQIWIYDFDAKEERQLTQGSGNKENPSWAQDSLHLVFNSADSASSELYIVNLNQPEAVKITQGAGKKHYPTWGTR